MLTETRKRWSLKYAAQATMALTCLGIFPAQASAQTRADGLGFDIYFGPGANMCISSGAARCDYYQPSYAVFLAPGFRLNRYVGAYLDFTTGTVNTKVVTGSELQDHEIIAAYGNRAEQFAVTETVRWFVPVGIAQLYCGAGMGLSTLTVFTDQDSGVESETVWGFPSMKANAGVVFRIVSVMSVGLNADLLFILDGRGRRHHEQSGAGQLPIDEWAENTGDVQDMLQLTATALFHF